MHKYYAARAPYYDAVYQRPERQEDIAFLSRRLPQYFKDAEVLEIACGTGYWTQYIASAAKRVLASDGTAEPLAIASNRPGLDCVNFVLANAYDLSDELGLFTAAFAGLWFSHVPIERRSAFLSGIHRLLVSGARVVFIDNTEVQLEDYPIIEHDQFGNTYQRRKLQDGTFFRVLKNFPTAEEMRRVLGSISKNFSYTKLDHFWLVEYELR